jgi:hypothetical protein
VAIEEAPALNIIVDANVIIAALIQRGIVRQLVLAHPGGFLTPVACVQSPVPVRDDRYIS